MTEIPTLKTDRLILRPMRAQDWEGYQRLMTSARATYMGGPFSLPVAWGMFCADHAQWSLFGCGALMIDEAASGTCLGQVGINAGPLFPEHELGRYLYPQAEGKGFAQEAAGALRSWGRDVKGLATLVSYIDPDNARSARLAERLGATLNAQAPRQDPTT